MKMLLLEGISPHGKNRVQQHGAEWNMLFTSPVIQAASHPRLKGPLAKAILAKQQSIKAYVMSERTGECRWVSLTDDPDFSIMTKEELR
tara:strand:+ start:611 stop:877 length:267 start_codon:yes stop_codon:yes gene_type:complete